LARWEAIARQELKASHRLPVPCSRPGVQ
jgi:hypothetical protein